ncbi:hypothetical protein L917_03181 [Phytophthora nicotianae]|uniref:Uncharacterized protein n=1 Tax=Phytophthora nicotianae TaxID=4792 RepID=W2JMH3_PHYNI|nr:hypothetical protein L916_03253 [Phytophthora nicotianae]ETM00066.1 hypothetical protein L917_03181 [Phytophthora nicotianae]ETM53248.1 hypothetical protein L914_03262 [Phytophthora nicotianae]
MANEPNQPIKRQSREFEFVVQEDSSYFTSSAGAQNKCGFLKHPDR